MQSPVWFRNSIGARGSILFPSVAEFMECFRLLEPQKKGAGIIGEGPPKAEKKRPSVATIAE